MGHKIVVNDNICSCPSCGYQWNAMFGMAELNFDEDECCPCCPECGELIEDVDECL